MVSTGHALQSHNRKLQRAYDLFGIFSRDRKQAELELQNARRKETREMARDLESQLAAVERIAQVGIVLPSSRAVDLP